MYEIVQKVGISVASLLLVSLLMQKKKRRITLHYSKYGLDHLLTELESKGGATVLSRGEEEIEVMA